MLQLVHLKPDVTGTGPYLFVNEQSVVPDWADHQPLNENGVNI